MLKFFAHRLLKTSLVHSTIRHLPSSYLPMKLLAEAGITALTAAQTQALIVSSGALDETTLASTTTVTASDQTNVYPVAGRCRR